MRAGRRGFGFKEALLTTMISLRSIALFGCALPLSFATACSEQASPGSAPSATATAAAASPTATAAARATAAAATAVPLGERFAGPAPEGIKRSGQRLGVPTGWQTGEFGEVQTPSKDGYAALHDLPQFPPQLSQVELRVTSMGCKSPKLEPAVDGTVGSKKVPAKISQGTCTLDGAPAAVWTVSVNIDKNDNPKVIIVAIKESARAGLEKDVAAVAQGYADAW
jgi:hypothetical protein